MNRCVVPACGVLGVAALASLLILQVVWRPWSDTDRSWETDLNVQEVVPPDYTRTPVAYVGDQIGGMGGWTLDPAAVGQGPKGRALYVAKGCASCHGLEAQGGLLGPALDGLEVGTVLKQVRAPGGRMAPYSPKDLDDQELEEIARYLSGLAGSVVGARGPKGRALYVAKGCAGCHGLEAQGGPAGPALGGIEIAEVLKQVRAPAGPMPRYALKDLNDQQLEEIARYLGGLPRRRTPPPTESRR